MIFRVVYFYICINCAHGVLMVAIRYLSWLSDPVLTNKLIIDASRQSVGFMYTLLKLLLYAFNLFLLLVYSIGSILFDHECCILLDSTLISILSWAQLHNKCSITFPFLEVQLVLPWPLFISIPHGAQSASHNHLIHIYYHRCWLL